MLLTISALAFAAFGTATASAGIVCMINGGQTAAFFDSNSQEAQNECALPPTQAAQPETNNLTVTRVIGDDPTQPGQQQVTQIRFDDPNNPIVIGDDNTSPPVCTLDGATAVCPASTYTFDLGGGDDSATINGAPNSLPPTSGVPFGACVGNAAFGGNVLIPTGGPGNDTFTGSNGSDVFNGGPGDDTANGNGGSDSFAGDDGNDTLGGGDGADCLDGGPGNDVENGDAGDDNIDGIGGSYNSGNDQENGGDGNDSLGTGPGPDNSGPPNANVQTTDSDTLNGGNGVDTVDYGEQFGGNQKTNIAAQAVPFVETADGQPGDGEGPHPDFNNPGQGRPDLPAENDNIGTDVEDIFGNNIDPNNIVGNNDDDLLVGGAYADTIQGNGGDDTIEGGDGADNLQGGDGNDNVFGQNGNDTIDGGAGNDTLYGGAQNDQVNGGAGDDTLNNSGPSRPDASVPDSDTDQYSGGDGEDIVNYDNGPSDPVTVTIDGVANDGEQNVPNRLTENDNVATDVEDVSGGAGNDSLTGNGGDNNLFGNDGNDTINGGGGNDGLFGGRGNDTLDARGAKGSAHVEGNEGNDILVSADATRDEDQCGGGSDQVQADGQDEVHGDCESVHVTPPAAAKIGTAAVTKTGYVTVRVTCPATEPRCTGVVTIKTAKRIGKIIIKLGNASYSANGGKTAVVKSLVPPKFRKVLHRAKRVKLAIAVTNVNATTGLSSTKRATKTVKTTALH